MALSIKVDKELMKIVRDLWVLYCKDMGYPPPKWVKRKK